MERHGRAGEASEPESHPIKESRDTSNSTSSKNILGNEITAIGLSQVEEVPNSGVLRVGLGTFSAVYEGLRLLDHKQVAIKFEVGNSSFSQLQAESRTYKSLKGWNRAPDVVFFGDHGRSRLLVMDLLGPSLEDLLDYCGRRFTIETVVMIGVQLITILEELHDRDFIHRDIKAENFVIQGGTERPNFARAIDFATAKSTEAATPQGTLCIAREANSLERHDTPASTRIWDANSQGEMTSRLFGICYSTSSEESCHGNVPHQLPEQRSTREFAKPSRRQRSKIYVRDALSCVQASDTFAAWALKRILTTTTSASFYRLWRGGLEMLKTVNTTGTSYLRRLG
ncbi:Casein kinase I RAG8 like protein [Verticillium longisporum]|nr:Casein kinase I RAG8 like protein [Verticillium longisporum]